MLLSQGRRSVVRWGPVGWNERLDIMQRLEVMEKRVFR